MVGVPFLDKIPTFKASFPSAKLYVEWALGADLVGDPAGSGWSWTDISSDVLQEGGKVITISPAGRSDATTSSQPAGCSFELDNRSGAYSKGPQGSNYPNVRLNVPIRVSVSMTGVDVARQVRFQGFAYSFQPSWDTTGNFAVVSVQAAGASRRLAQGSAAVQSPLSRYYQLESGAVAYWPMEDADATYWLTSGLPGGTRFNFSNLTLANYTGITGSSALPTFSATTTYTAQIAYSFASHWQTDFMFYMPNAPGADVAVMRIHTVGSAVTRWEITIPSGSTTNIRVTGYDNSATLVVNNSTSVGVSVGEPISVRFMTRVSGGNIQYQLVVFHAFTGAGAVVGSAGTVAGAPGNISEISMLASANMNGVSIGHVAIFDEYDHAYAGNGDDSFTAYESELVTDRLDRLATQQNIPIGWVTASIDYMGAQPVDKPLAILAECEVADQGLLFDGFNPGYTFKGRQELINQSVGLTTLVQTDLMPVFQPVDDDQEITNYVTATRKGGGSATVEQVTGTLGTATILRYEDSVSGLNINDDNNVQNYASWRMHFGTVDGYRYPTINLDFRKIPARANEWFALSPGFRIDVSGLSSYVTQHPSNVLSLLVLGWTERLSRFVWDATLNCVPYDPYRVIVLNSTDAAAVNEFGQSLDSDASTLSTGYSAGTTSISVATASNSPLWTTASANYPLDLNVGGWRVTVTAVSGASSPQTFTVNALPGAVSSGASVSLWYPPTLGL